MTTLQILVLAAVQGICELLPVSSSTHVILAEKLMGLDPTAPEMTLLLVMLHTGTMFAAIVYFWSTWRARYFASGPMFAAFARDVTVATALTGVIGLALMKLIEQVVLGGHERAEIEHLFGNTRLMAGGLCAVGLMIIVSARRPQGPDSLEPLGPRAAALIGIVQGLCLPFRGFSRSGATISTGLMLGVGQLRAEAFSFALAVVLTPAVIVKEAYRLFKAQGAAGLDATRLTELLLPDLIGMAAAFVAGLVALRWLARWLETGRWHIFGYYCLALAAVLAIWS